MKNVRENGLMLLIGVVLILCGFSNPLVAATVKATSKKLLLVKLDVADEIGYAKGVTVCFFSKANKRVGCGKVTKAKGPVVFVKVSKITFPKIKKGFTAKLRAGKAPGEEAAPEEAGAVVAGKHRTNIKLGYVFSALTPSTYNKLTYLQPIVVKDDKVVKEEVDTLWKAEDKASLSIFGFYAESEFAVSSFSMSIGLRYRAHRDFIAQADYDIRDVEQYVETTQTATALGFYSDFTFVDIAFTDAFFWRLSSGLDLDMATMNFKAEHKVDSDKNGDDKVVDALGELASATSKISVLSLRLGSNFSWLVLDPVGIVLGANILVPLAEFGKSFSGKITNEQVSKDEYLGKDVDGLEDLEKSLDHKKASVGAEIIMGGYIAF